MRHAAGRLKINGLFLKNENTHRTFYGGAFGTIDPFRLTFRTIQQSAIHADGIVRQTVGVNLTTETDPKTILGGIGIRPLD